MFGFLLSSGLVWVMQKTGTPITKSNEENKIAQESLAASRKNDEIPAGVSIESASYIESNSSVNHQIFSQEKNLAKEDLDEEFTPKLFVEDQNQIETKEPDLENEEEPDKLFEQDVNEDEDFEIPAFLRRQKF